MGTKKSDGANGALDEGVVRAVCPSWRVGIYNSMKKNQGRGCMRSQCSVHCYEKISYGFLTPIRVALMNQVVLKT